MRTLLMAALLLFPSVVLASEGEFSVASAFFQMLGSLALVLGLIFLFYHFSSKWLKITPSGKGATRYIRVVENRMLAPKKSLLLVEVGGEYLLLSNCNDRVQLVKQIDMLEEIEVVEERVPLTEFSIQLRDRLSSLTEKLPGLVRLVPLPKKQGEVL
ncbi:flagellar biosynthetic protein FliO [Geotalea sp. SG265]|uniref:FliO/MopB family protein n=1 Tax=Geotalea sp. SG265 TaxID=2922867 RepID=UPI001FAF30DA|nr:flagellar biosynthetic protein FliO [Geotalea sp. SG265]